ncbi:MAG TPA: hypothetical protein VG476_02255 [Acidimicrobiales bacterium]|nr:hypothetical protein [Acidimicrobiales bacterium]
MTAREVQGQLLAELQQQLTGLDAEGGAFGPSGAEGGPTPAERVLLLARAYRHLAGSGEGRAPDGVMELVLDAIGKAASEPRDAEHLAEAFDLLAGPL